MRFKFKKILPLLIILLFAVSGYLGAYLSENSPDISNDENTEAAGQQGDRLVLNSVMVITYRYIPCAHTYTEEMEVPAKYVGMNREEFKEAVPGCSVWVFLSKRVEIEIRYDCYCEQHLIAYLTGSRVAVMQCIPRTSDSRELFSVYIDPNKLSKEQEESLTSGKVFQSEREAREYLLALL